MADPATGALRRFAVLRTFGLRAAATDVVRAHRSSPRARPILPLWLKQSRQPVGAYRISAGIRALVDRCSPEPTLDAAVRCVCRLARRVCAPVGTKCNARPGNGGTTVAPCIARGRSVAGMAGVGLAPFCFLSSLSPRQRGV